MAITTAKMMGIILENGHLVLEGDESREDLIDALFNLREHTYTDCRLPINNVTPIEILIPDFRVFNPRRSRKSNVVSVDISGDVL